MHMRWICAFREFFDDTHGVVTAASAWKDKKTSGLDFTLKPLTFAQATEWGP